MEDLALKRYSRSEATCLRSPPKGICIYLRWLHYWSIDLLQLGNWDRAGGFNGAWVAFSVCVSEDSISSSCSPCPRGSSWCAEHHYHVTCHLINCWSEYIALIILTHNFRVVREKVPGTLPIIDGDGAVGDPASETIQLRYAFHWRHCWVLQA